MDKYVIINKENQYLYRNLRLIHKCSSILVFQNEYDQYLFFDSDKIEEIIDEVQVPNELVDSFTQLKLVNQPRVFDPFNNWY